MIETNVSEFGQIPPQDVKIEVALLGTILAFKDYQELIIPQLTEDMWYVEAHIKIFQAINDLYKSGHGIDMLTVVNKLRDLSHLDEVGGAYYVSTLTSQIGSGTNYETHIRIFKELHIRRSLIKLFSEETRNLFSGENDIAETYATVGKALEDIFTITSSNIHNMYDVMYDRINEIERIKAGELLGVSSGFKSLDSITGGWQNGDMIVLAGRPSMGKTIISTMFAKYPVQQNKSILYFSLEMPMKRIADRVISLDTGICSVKIQFNNLRSDDWINIHDNVEKYNDTGFYINDESGMTIEKITSAAITHSTKTDIHLIIIDYMQLIPFSLKTNSTNDQIAHISKGIKALAKKINVPVIVLSQLNREVEKRGDKRPIMADLRDSGSIEQDADIIMFLYRDEYYYDNSEEKNKIDILLRKQRNGEIGVVSLYRNDTWSRISEQEIIEIPEF